MCFRCRAIALVLSVLAGLVGRVELAIAAQVPPSKRILRIAADPNNLPFSNERLEGFENKIAELIASDLDCSVQYVWRAQRRGFFRETLKSGNCDVVLGVPVGFERSLNTIPYYRSAYAFVWRKGSNLHVQSLDDPILHRLKIGVQLIGDDGMNTPPAHALAARSIITNVVGYTVYGDYRQRNPAARIVEAVAEGKIVLALVWGPLGGYFARHSTVPLEVVPISLEGKSTDLPLAFSIAMGVRKEESALRDQLDEIITKEQKQIDIILREYGVPLIKEENHTHTPTGQAQSKTRLTFQSDDGESCPMRSRVEFFPDWELRQVFDCACPAPLFISTGIAVSHTAYMDAALIKP